MLVFLKFLLKIIYLNDKATKKGRGTETKFSGWNGAGLKSGAASGSATLVAGTQ